MRFPLWKCPACSCQRNWASRLTCHICFEKRPKGIKPPPIPPSVRVRPQAPPSQVAPRMRRPQSPSTAAAPPLTPASQVAEPAVKGHKDIEASVKSLKVYVASLESLAEGDPLYYAPLLLKAQTDLTAALGALQRSKPISSQLTSCLSKKIHADKLVETTARELQELMLLTEEKRLAHEAAMKNKDELEEELQRLSLLNAVPAMGPTQPSAANAALLAVLTPDIVKQLTLLMGALQGPGGAAILAATGNGVPPPGDGSATPRVSQAPTTPQLKEDRGAGTSTVPGKSRSRSPTDRHVEVPGIRPGGLTIEGLVQLQTVLGMLVAVTTPVQDVDEDMKEDEL